MDKRQLGGLSGFLANVALFANGLIGFLKGQNSDTRSAGLGRMATSIMWGMSGYLLMRYGNRPVSEQLSKIQEKLSAFLQDEGVSLSDNHQSHADKYLKRTQWQKFEDTLYNYPIESGNVYNSIASAGMIVSGVFRHKGTTDDKTAGNANFLTSVFTIGGTLLSIFIPERTPEQIAARGQSGTLWGKVQERPLNYAVWSFFAADIASGWEAFGEFGKAKNLPKTEANDRFRPWAYAMSILSIVSMFGALLGDVLSGFSSKKTGGSKEDREAAQAQLIDEAAALLAEQPEELRQRAATYLSKQPELRMTDYDANMLEQKIAEIIKNKALTHESRATLASPSLTHSLILG